MKTLVKRFRLKKAEPKKRTKEQEIMHNIRQVCNRVRTGDLDLDKLSHRINLNIAMKKGFIIKDEEGNYIVVDKEEQK